MSESQSFEYTPEVLQQLREGKSVDDIAKADEKEGKPEPENKKEQDVEDISDGDIEDADDDYEKESDDEGDQEYSPEEVRAREQGWVPEDEWTGDPADWVPAREFNQRGELMGRISQQGKHIKTIEKEKQELKKAVQALKEHQKKLAKLEYERALKTLKKEKAAALEDQDFEAYDELSERYSELKQASEEDFDIEDSTSESEENEQQGVQLSTEEKQVANQWQERNTWFGKDSAMTGAANALGDQYLYDNPGDVVGMFKYIDQQMRKEFPHKFKRQTPNRGQVVESDGRGAAQRKGRAKKYSPKDLSDDQRSVARTFVKQGVYKNMQEYVDELAELQELPAQQEK